MASPVPLVRECGRIDEHARHEWQRSTYRGGEPVQQHFVCAGVTVIVVSNEPAASAYVPAQPLEVAYSARCDFCRAPVLLQRVGAPQSPFWGLEAVFEGAGSDHLATWCHVCGPRHRKDEWRLQS